MNSFVLFLKEAWAELKQVAWLPVPQMIGSTWLVVILVMIMAAFLFMVDQILKFIFSWIF